MFGEKRIGSLVAAVGLALLITSGAAAGETIRLDPPGATHIVGTAAFSVFVKADNATSLSGYQFSLNYNSSSVIAGNVGTLAAASPDSTLASNVTTLSTGSPDTTLTSAMTSTTVFSAPTQTSVASPGVSTTTLTTGITAAGTALTLGSSGLISPGGTTLAAAITTTTGPTTITLPSTAGINQNDTLHIDTEDVRVTTISAATTLIVARGVNGTTAATHAMSVVVKIYPTIRIDAEDMAVVTVPDVTHVTVTRGVNGTTAASHSAAAPVLNEPSVVRVQSTVGFAACSAAPATCIQIDGEQMTVVSTTDNATASTLTVTRAVNGTTASAHTVGAAVVLQPTQLQVASTAGLAVSNTIQVDAERMTITSVTPGAPGYIGVTRGVGGTTPASHPNGTLVVKQPDTANVASAAGLAPGNTIQVEGETMTISSIVANSLTVTRAVGSAASNHSIGAVVVKQPTTLSVASTAGISAGSVILIGSEQMGVQSVGAGTLNVLRGYAATTAATHATGATVWLLSIGAGASSIQVMTDVIGSPPANVALGGGTSETVTVTSKSGAGPYVYNLSPATAQVHAAGGTVGAQPSVLTLSSTSGLINGSTIQLEAEQMTVIAISSPNITVTRGVNGTTTASHAVGVPVTVQVVGAGAGTVSSVSDILFNVALPASLSIDPNGLNPETMTATAKSGSGSGPFTYTLSTPTAFAHAAGATIQNPALTFGGALSVRNGAWSQMIAPSLASDMSIKVAADALQGATLPAPLIVGYGLSSQEVASVASKSATAGGYMYGLSAPLSYAHAAGVYVTPSTTPSYPGVAADWLESTGRTAACSYTPTGSGNVLFGCTTFDFACQNPSATTTLASASLAGASQIIVAQDVLVGQTLPKGVIIEQGTGSAEGVSVTAKSGAGPFTYTLAAPAVLAHPFMAPVNYQTGCTARVGPTGSDVILATVFFTPSSVGPGTLQFPDSTDTLLLEFNPAQPLQPVVVTSTNGLTVLSGVAPVMRCPDLDPVTPKVGFGDLSVFAMAYGSTGPPGPSSTWNPLADLNGDNKVGFLDLSLLAGVYNQICP